MNPDQEFILESSDQQTYSIPIKLAMKSTLLKEQIEQANDNPDILKEALKVDVRSQILAKIVEFLKYEDAHPHTTIEKPLKTSEYKDIVGAHYAKFFDIPNTDLFELILKANYLSIPSLLDIACAKVAAMTRNKSVETLRKEFGVKNDFTPEEEQPIIEEQKWLDEA